MKKDILNALKKRSYKICCIGRPKPADRYIWLTLEAIGVTIAASRVGQEVTGMSIGSREKPIDNPDLYGSRKGCTVNPGACTAYVLKLLNAYF